jgi:AcrR family transcriptional regulator
MARQVRSKATREKIIEAAVDTFGEVGYADAGWGTIIERTGMTKGALYHHFDSKEALASTIIDEGSDTLVGAFRNVCGSGSPALENMIHGTFMVANVLGSNKTARAAEQLTAALSGFNEAAARFCTNFVNLMADQVRRATAEGDLRGDLDPAVVSESIVGAMFGTWLLSKAMSGHAPVEHVTTQLSRIWGLLLPGMATEESLSYFQQFLAREAMRHAQPAEPESG